MVKYNCVQCGKEFCQKSNWLQHTSNKKFPCKKKCEEGSNEFQNIPKYSKQFQNIPKNLKNFQNNSECVEESIIKYEITHNLENKQILENICGYCKKNFSNIGNLNKHIRNNCKIKKEQEKEKEEIFKKLLLKDEIIRSQNEKMSKLDETISELCKNVKFIEEQNQQLQIQLKNLSNKDPKYVKTNTTNTTNNMINSNNTTNTTNNIIMVNYGKENLEMIDNSHFMKIVRNPLITGVKIPEEILKLIHFNPAYPELSNIYISDINREKCMVWQDGEWKLSSVDKIPEIIDRVVIYSNEIENELREKFINNKKINERLDVVNKYVKMNDSEYIEELKEDIGINSNLIKRCEGFQKLTYDTFKTLLYNEGKDRKSVV